jgi:hypothetical protein
MGAVPIHWGVKSTQFLSFLAGLMTAAIATAAEGAPPLAPLPKVPAELADGGPSSAVKAPPQVIAAASAAVASLGDEVVLGRYQVAVERMNPRWKERVAKRMGGMEALEKQLSDVGKQMVQQGVSMISFRPQGAPQSFEVGPGKKVEKVNGQEVETLVFNQWLVLIPTLTKFRIIRQNEKPLVIESVGFQVAVSDKSKNDWTFIDGSGLSVNDLRSLYGTLPADIKLPPVEKREAQAR